MIRSRHFSRLVSAAAAHAVIAIAMADGPALPAYLSKTPDWKTGIVTHDGVVWDAQLAAWMKQAQNDAKAAIPGNWKLRVRCTFTHCYSGGMLHELLAVSGGDEGLTDFAGNSASRFFEPAHGTEAGVGYSFYANAWQKRAAIAATADPVHSFLAITEKAWTALKEGEADVPVHGGVARENPQYVQHVPGAPRSEPSDPRTNGPGDLLQGPDAHKLAILFAGDPQNRHRNNLTAIRTVLKEKYGFKDANIWIMYGDKGPNDEIDGATWTSSAKATGPNLKKALVDGEGFLRSRIAALADGRDLDDTTVKLFLWTTNHGTADVPITIGVAAGTTGAAGDVKVRAAAGTNPERYVYGAGSESNSEAFDPNLYTLRMLPVDSISGGYDFVRGELGAYFSVTPASTGLGGSGLERVVDKTWNRAAQVFTSSGVGNREFIAPKALGLLGAAADPDDVSALSMTPASLHFAPADPDARPAVAAEPRVAFFFTHPDSPVIWVVDGKHPVAPGMLKTYKFWDPMRDGWSKVPVQPRNPDDPPQMMDEAKPARLDALALYVDMRELCRYANSADPDDPRQGDFVFKPGIDAFLFSVPKGDAFRGGSGCKIYRWDGRKIDEVFSCTALGLKADADVDALDTYADAAFRYRNDPEFQNDELPSNLGCAADFDLDDIVNGVDLGILLANWGDDCGFGDLNGDGVVDPADLGMLLAAWGPCP